MVKIKPDGFIPEIGASCEEEPALGVSATTPFEDEAVCLALGAIANQRSDGRKENKGNSFLKTLTDTLEDEGESNDDSSKTVAFL